MNRNKYQRITKEEKEKIKRLSLDGKSLREISKIMNLGITTIYYQVRKFKPKQRKDFNPVGLNSEKIGELIGAFAGDGSYYPSIHKRICHHKIRYSLSFKKDKPYAEYLRTLLRQLNLNPFLIISSHNIEPDSIEILVNSRTYMEFIKKFLFWEGKKTYSVCLRSPLGEYNEDFLIGFARGLMDTDGFVELYNVSCGCVSKELIGNLTDIFNKLGISYKVSKRIKEGRRDLFLIRVPKGGLRKYHKLIGFSNPYKLNKLKQILKI